MNNALLFHEFITKKNKDKSVPRCYDPYDESVGYWINLLAIKKKAKQKDEEKREKESADVGGLLDDCIIS